MSQFDYIVILLRMIGSLGLFLYGMKLMSESVLKVAGDRFRSTVTTITSDRWRGLATGFVSTSVIQSSTAITVLTVSLVNAGVVTLPGSISIIIGANIGTTITGWLVSLLGFSIQMTTLALTIFAIAIPIYITGKRKSRNWSEFMIGFALLFIGLQLLRDSLPDINENPEIISWLSGISSDFVFSGIIFLIAGTIITMVLQSSSAVMSLALVLASGDLISFHDAAALIIGLNIGTTISANLASLVAGRDARIAARAHFIFNLVGAIWAFPLLNYILNIIDVSMLKSGYGSPSLSSISMPVGLAIFHSLFNIANSILLIGFIPWLQKAGSRLVFLKTADDDHNQLRYLNGGFLSTSEISMIQVRTRMKQMFHYATDSLGILSKLLAEKDPALYNKMFKKVKRNEKDSDQTEDEINLFLSALSSDNLSFSATQEIHMIIKVTDELETITDYCRGIAGAIDTKNNEKIWFTQELRDKLNLILEKAKELLEITEAAFYGHLQFEDACKQGNRLENEINELKSRFRQEHLVPDENKEYSFRAGITYLSLISGAEKIGDHCMNILSAIAIRQKSTSRM